MAESKAYELPDKKKGRVICNMNDKSMVFEDI